MASITYKSQPATHQTRGSIPLDGNNRVFTVLSRIWPDEVEAFIDECIVGTSLHMCSGKSTLGDVKLDLNEATADIRCDASDCREFVADKSYDTVIYDGPYNSRPEWMHNVYSELARIARKRIIVQAWHLMADKKGRYRKDHSFELTSSHVWAPRSYFGRANIIQIFDFRGDISVADNDQPEKQTVSVRRKEGDYHTPPMYAKLAHQYMAASFNKTDDSIYSHSWWDPACGTGALIQDCPNDMKGSLFLSSLSADDLKIAASRFNGTVTSFMYDFLDSDSEPLPSNLLTQLKGTSRLVMLVNPPFTATTSVRGEQIDSISNTVTANKMRLAGMKRQSHVSTMQYLYNIAELAETFKLQMQIGVFSQAAFLTHESYSQFRSYWLSRFEYCNGFCVNGREFDASGEWPLTFTTWKTRSANSIGAAPKFNLDVYIAGNRTSTKKFGLVGEPLTNWVDRPIGSVQAVPLKSALNPDLRNMRRVRKLPINALGWAGVTSNDVFHSKYCCLLSSAAANGAGWGITVDNMEKSLIVLAIRCIVQPTWENDRDCFSIPDVTRAGWLEWSRDAVAWFIASGSNHSSSMGPFEYNGSIVELTNEFLWMSPKELVDINGMSDDSRFAANLDRRHPFTSWLSAQEFSVDAEHTLQYMRDAIIETSSLRKQADPKYQLNRWDAGWYQIRMGLLWERGAKKRANGLVAGYRDFKRQHAQLRQRLQDGVYDFGVLPR